jgi:hypothetical protein
MYLLINIGCMGFGVRNVSFEEIRREELRGGAILH